MARSYTAVHLSLDLSLPCLITITKQLLQSGSVERYVLLTQYPIALTSITIAMSSTYKIYCYVPTTAWLLAYARLKKIANYEDNNLKSKITARAASLRDMVTEIGLQGPTSDHVKLVRVKGMPRWAVVLRNNWGDQGATDQQIEHMKRILGIEQNPTWLPLYCKDYFV